MYSLNSHSKENETTLLDSSTVPTYEEFQYKQKPINTNRLLSDQTPRFLNSTEYFEQTSSKILITDDESDSDDNQTVLDTSLTKSSKSADQLSYRLGNINLNSLTPKMRELCSTQISKTRPSDKKPAPYGHLQAKPKANDVYNNQDSDRSSVPALANDVCKTTSKEQDQRIATPTTKSYQSAKTPKDQRASPKIKDYEKRATPRKPETPNHKLDVSTEYLVCCDKTVQTSPLVDQDAESDNETNMRLYLSKSCNKTDLTKTTTRLVVSGDNDVDDMEPRTPTTQASRQLATPIRQQQESSACPKTLIRVLDNFIVSSLGCIIPLVVDIEHHSHWQIKIIPIRYFKPNEKVADDLSVMKYKDFTPRQTSSLLPSQIQPYLPNESNADNSVDTKYYPINKNLLIIKHQKTKPSNKRVSMCVEELDQESHDLIEKDLDEDLNNFDLTHGNIVVLDSDDDDRKQKAKKAETQKKFIINDTISENENEDEEEEAKGQKNVEIAKTTPKARKQIAYTDSDDNDEAFENFLQNYRTKNNGQKTAHAMSTSKKTTNDFVVSDNDDDNDTESNSNDQSDATSDNDDQLFYIRTTRKLSEKVNTKRSRSDRTETSSTSNERSAYTTARTTILNTTSSSSSSPTSVDSDSSVHYDTPIKSKGPIRRKNSESALETIFKTPATNKDRINRNPQTEVKQKYQTKPTTHQKYGFIESLSYGVTESMKHTESIDYIKKFSNKKVKDELLHKIFGLFNEAVFDKKLPVDMKLVWNNRLTSTAGMCKYKIGEKGTPTAEIHISSKVCDTPERLRDTLVHEMCHSAVYLLNGSKTEGHGRLWQYWAYKVSEVFKNIPKVSTSHNYTINKKFIYKCQDCGQEIHRFQKSIDLDKNLCGRCHGRFTLQSGNPKALASAANLGENQTPTPRKLNSFALFVQEKYNIIKTEQKLNTHKDVMQEISKQFKMLSTK